METAGKKIYYKKSRTQIEIRRKKGVKNKIEIT
jgi:hypothetical protein